jgi:hypothetical protein
MPETASPAQAASPSPSQRRGPLRLLLDLFSSVRFGVVLMAILFVYSSIGSAGVLYPSSEGWAHDQLRQWRPFEMTEFEWFHWWPFDLMMILIAITITVTTIRKIPFKPVNYGVWTIHAGILLMMLGCWIYFGTKVEGDAPVVRRTIVAEVLTTKADGTKAVAHRAEVVASPGQRLAIGDSERRYELEVQSIDPEWELQSEELKGQQDYSVNVLVRRTAPESTTFVRQLLAAHPEHTEDVLLTGDPNQPMKRAKKELGTPTIDEELRLSLVYEPSRWFYLRNELAKSWALYVREASPSGEPKGPWIERRVEGLPLYNDYIGDRSLVYQQTGEPPMPLDPIDIPVRATDPNDPFPDLEFRFTGFLRYAMTRSQFIPGGANAPVNPVARMLVTGPDGQRGSYQLVALDPRENKADEGVLQFRYVANEASFEALKAGPTLRFRIPSLGIDHREPITSIALDNRDVPFKPIPVPAGTAVEPGKGYAYRVITVQDDLPFAAGSSSVAVVEITTPTGSYRRWVFADPALTRDVTEELLKDPRAPKVVGDPSIQIDYEPGHGLALVVLVAGPDPNRLRLISAITDTPVVSDVSLRQGIPLPAGLVATVVEYEPRAVSEVKPFVVPKNQRHRDAGTQFAQVLLETPGALGEDAKQWIRYHHFVFEDEEEVIRRFNYTPSVVRLADGRAVEVMFSRQRLPLPAEIALEEFVLTTNIGGFTGETGSIRDYTSMVRFRPNGDEAAAWTDPKPVSMNKPIEHAGLAYFQSQWDPPDQARFEGDRASLGLNYTVLGVANRNGVWTMLIGCCISVLGMIYAFYVKPVIKRRQREAVLAGLAAAGSTSPAGRPASPSAATVVAAETAS